MAAKTAKPGDNLQTIFQGLRAGDVLTLAPGLYAGNVKFTAAAGTASLPIVVKGAGATLSGLLWLTNPTHWRIEGLTVTWPETGAGAGDHMVKMSGGIGWVLSGCTLSGARSYAALLVAGTATDWAVRGCTIKDTHKSNDTNQDHLIYVNSQGKNGLIENCTLTNSPNGRAIKVGPASSSGAGTTGGLTIRGNRMSDNTGPSNVQLAWLTSNVLIEGNAMRRPGAGRSAVTAYQLTGTNNVVRNNLVSGTTSVFDKATGMVDGGGNQIVQDAWASFTKPTTPPVTTDPAPTTPTTPTAPTTPPKVEPTPPTAADLAAVEEQLRAAKAEMTLLQGEAEALRTDLARERGKTALLQGVIDKIRSVLP